MVKILKETLRRFFIGKIQNSCEKIKKISKVTFKILCFLIDFWELRNLPYFVSVFLMSFHLNCSLLHRLIILIILRVDLNYCLFFQISQREIREHKTTLSTLLIGCWFSSLDFFFFFLNILEAFHLFMREFSSTKKRFSSKMKNVWSYSDEIAKLNT